MCGICGVLPVDKADTLEHRLRYVVRTREEVDGAADLADFARWVLESDDADYVDESVLRTHDVSPTAVR